LDGGLRSAAAKKRLLKVTHVDLLVFWENLVEIAQEFDVLTGGLKDGSVHETRQRQQRRFTSVSS